MSVADIVWTNRRPLALAAAYLAIPATSGYVFRGVMRAFLDEAVLTDLDDTTRDTGTLVGKCENVLVLTFVVASAYTALAVLFAAKSIVRRKDIDSEDTAYYIAGTLVNFTYSLLASFAVVTALAAV